MLLSERENGEVAIQAKENDPLTASSVEQPPEKKGRFQLVSKLASQQYKLSELKILSTITGSTLSNYNIKAS